MKKKYVEIIVEELSKKFNKKPQIIGYMLQIIINDNCSIEEAKKCIIDFYKFQT